MILLIISSSFAEYQEVKIGSIDKKYKDILTHKQLTSILKDIEHQFESQLGFKVFGISENGKPIDILYIGESRKKKNLKRYMRNLDSIQNKIKKLNQEINTEQIKSAELSNKLSSEVTILNQMVAKLNKYISTTFDESKQLTTDEYNTAKAYVTKEQNSINKNKKLFNKKRKAYNRQLKTIKRKISKYNVLVRKHNNVSRKIEVLSNSIQEVKGKTIAKNITQVKTFHKDGETQVEKSSRLEMQKIEVYSFEEDLAYLKAVLAHEIAHLVGVNHSNESGALMHPTLQENQIKRLDLKHSDIQGFNEAFNF